MARVMLGVLVVVGLGAACWAAFGAQPASQRSVVSGSAVVVSSLACADGAGGIAASAGTLVDVTDPLGGPAGGTVRASLDACGYREGQQLAVEYLPGDPAHVTLAGSTGSSSAADGTGTRLLPFGIAIAALLAVGAALAVVVDGRRTRRRGRGQRTAAHSRMEISEAGSVGGDSGALGSGAGTGTGAGVGVGQGRLSVVTMLPAPTFQVVGDRSLSNGSAGQDERSPQLSSIDLVFPFSATLAASLHDELFTHRSPVG